MMGIAPRESADLQTNFAEAASAVLSQIAGETIEAKQTEAAIPTGAATMLRVEISGALVGHCEIALSSKMTARFAAALTGEPEGECNDEAREAANELIQQICGNAADRLRRLYGPLELKPQPAERDAGSGVRKLIRMVGGERALEFELHILKLAQAAKQPEPAAPPQASAPAPAAEPATSPKNSRNLDLLLDIELGASLRFGSRQMLLKEIIELCSGSVVELDRRVQDPVDLLIDGRLIAQGEVVIVGGNYGLRITRVANQIEKVACLQ